MVLLESLCKFKHRSSHLRLILFADPECRVADNLGQGLERVDLCWRDPSFLLMYNNLTRDLRGKLPTYLGRYPHIAAGSSVRCVGIEGDFSHDLHDRNIRSL